jgi:hypothetical protein
MIGRKVMAATASRFATPLAFCTTPERAETSGSRLPKTGRWQELFGTGLLFPGFIGRSEYIRIMPKLLMT